MSKLHEAMDNYAHLLIEEFQDKEPKLLLAEITPFYLAMLRVFGITDLSVEDEIGGSLVGKGLGSLPEPEEVTTKPKLKLVH